MAQIVLLKTGMPVKLTSDFTITFNDLEGFLSEFVFKSKVFKYYTYDDMRDEDKKHSGLIGYYSEEIYLKYVQQIGTPPKTITDVKNSEFIFEDYRAKAGEQISVQVLDFGSPYDYYYKRKQYTWTLETDTQTHVAKWYKDLVQNIIVPPSIATVQPDNRNLNSNPRGLFYAKNLGSVINSWTTVTDADKQKFCRFTTLIAFQIYFTEMLIFPKLITPGQMIDVNNAADRPDPNDMSGLNDLQKMIFNLKKSWGYFYVAGSPHPHRQNFDPVLATPVLNDYVDYYNAINNFFRQTYVIQDSLPIDLADRIHLLLEVLPQPALRLLSFDVRTNALRKIMSKDMPDSVETFAMRIIYSFTTQEADAFLDFLLKIENGVKSNFDIIYRKMDDNRLARYVFVGWFANGAPNRQYFTYAVYELWKTSKYNSSYIPPGVTANADGLNPNAYFISDPAGIKYFEKTECILNYTAGKTSSLSTYGYMNNAVSEDVFESDIDGIKLIVNRVVKTLNSSTSAQYGTSTFPSKDPSYFGTYHLYQVIALIGYQPDVEVKLPGTPLMPAFLFHYIEEFDRLKEMDAAYNLAINIVIEAILAFFTGGASALKDLRYLKYVTKIGQAMRGVLPATESVLVWRGIDAGAQTFILSASVLNSINTYIGQTSNDPYIIALTKSVSKFMLYVSFASVSTSIFARAKAIGAANEVLDGMNSLPSGTPNTLPPELRPVLEGLLGQKDVAIAFFRDKLNTLGTDANTILSRFNGLFDDAERLAFWKAYDDVTDIKVWQALNEEFMVGASAHSLVDIWRNEITLLKIYKDEISFLSAFKRFKYERYHEFRHVRELTGDAGGHWHIYVSTDINPAGTFYKIVPSGTLPYNTNLGAANRTITTEINGHLIYKNLWSYNANTTPFTINNLFVSRKPLHYVVNPGWTDQQLMEEMAYAWSAKTQLRITVRNEKVVSGGIEEAITTTEFRSTFSDGTKIEFIQRSKQLDPVTQTIQSDHISLMKIVTAYKP